MKRLVLAALIALTVPAIIAAAPDVDLSWDERGDPDDLTVNAGETPAYSVLATTAVDLGSTDVEDKRITITLLNTTDTPETITTLLNESIPDDQLCYPAGCQDEYIADLTPSEYSGIGDYQVVTKVTQEVNGINEATTQTIQLTARPQGTLNIDYISCNDVVVQGAQQYCTTKITDNNGDAVSNAQFTLQYQDTNDVLGTCTTNQDGFCAVEPTITRDAGDYTVDATATKQYWLPDKDGQPTDTFTVLTKKYTVENLETWADDFQTTTDEYFRGDTPRASFDVRNDVTGERLTPEDGIVTDVTLRVYDNQNKAGGEPLKKQSLTPKDPVSGPGAFQFTLDQIPLTDDYLGQGKIFAFAINYTDNTGGQASKVVTIKNNPLEFTAIDDETIPAGETQTLDLTDNINDLETSDENIDVSFTNTGPYTVEQAGTLTYDIAAPSQEAQQTITVEADDTDGSTKTQSFTATTNALIPPEAEFSFTPDNPEVGQTVTFDATNSFDEDGTIESYEWTFNRPKSKQTGEQIQTSFNEPGSYDVTFTVTDNDGLTDTKTRTVTVADDNQEPTADFQYNPQSPETSKYVTFTSTSTDSDGFITQANWTVTGPNTDLAINGQDQFATPFTQPGDYDVTITVADDDGATDTTTKTITVTQANRAPQLETIPDQTTPEAQLYTYQAQATDPDGDELSWSISGAGFLTIDEDGQITGTPDYDDAGTYNVDVTVSDGSLTNTTTYTLTVTDVNRAPDASFQYQPTTPTVGEQVTITATSTDPDGDQLTHEWDFDGDGVTDATGEQVTYTFNEAGSQKATLTSNDGSLDDTATQTVPVSEEPNKAPFAAFDFTPDNPETGEQVTLDASDSFDEDGTIEDYTWKQGDTVVGSGQTTTITFNQPGDYPVTLTVTDDDGAQNSTTKTVPVEQSNRDPVLDPIPDQTVTVDTQVNVDADATDPDGDTVTYSISPDRGSFNTQTGEWTWTPSQTGTYTYTVTATDGRSGTDTESFTVTVTEEPNTPPFASFTANPSNPITGETVTLDAAQSFDSDGTIESYQWTFDGPKNTRTGEQIQTSFDEPGSYDVTLIVTDDDGAQNSTTKTVNVDQANRAPSLNPIPDQTTPEGDQYTYQASASDPDGDELSWSISGADFLTIDDNGLITGKPGFDDAGKYTVTVTVSDGTLEDTTTYTLTVEDTNRAPQADFQFEPSSPQAEQPVTFTATSTDPDGDSLTHEWDFDNDGETDATGEQVTYTFSEQGNYQVTLTSSDGSLSDTETKTVPVGEAPNKAPFASLTIDPDNPVTGEFITFTSTSTDGDGTIENYEWLLTGPNTSLPVASQEQFATTVETPGDYTITLTVTDDDGATNSTEQTFTVDQANRAPNANYTFTPTSPDTEDQVTFTATSTDPDGDQLTHEWDFDGDGVTDATGEQVTHIFDDPGNYEVTLTSSDESLNDSVTKTVSVELANQAPKADFNVTPANPTTDTTTTLTSNGSDPDGQILAYSWQITGPDGYESTINESAFPEHVIVGGFPTAGTYTVTHTVEDNDGATDSTTKDIDVAEANNAPTAAFTITPNQTFLVGDNATLTSESSDSDGTIEDYKWTVQQPNNITFERNNPSLTSITQIFIDAGEYTVTHTVTDDDGATDSTTQTVSVGDGTRPVARLDAPRKATKNQKVELDASESTDADGAIEAYEWTVTVRDTTVVETTTTTPTLTYTPQSTGTYEATVTVTDNDGLADTDRGSTTVSKEEVTVEPDTEVTLGQYGVYSDGGLGVIQKGEPFTVRAGVSNDGPQQAEDLRLTFTLPEYGYERNGQLFNSGDENGETRQINAYLPSYIPAGEYTGYVRVRGDDVHRQKTVPVTVTR